MFVIFISEIENTQNSFLFSPPFGPFCSVKYLSQFLGKSYRFKDSAYYTCLESRHPEVTKNIYYVFSNRRSQTPIFIGFSSWTIPPTYSSTDIWTPQIHVSDWLIICCWRKFDTLLKKK